VKHKNKPKNKQIVLKSLRSELALLHTDLFGSHEMRTIEKLHGIEGPMVVLVLVQQFCADGFYQPYDEFLRLEIQKRMPETLPTTIESVVEDAVTLQLLRRVTMNGKPFLTPYEMTHDIYTFAQAVKRCYTIGN
jgi:hypothetical protein